MSLLFETYTHKGNEFLNHVSSFLTIKEKSRSGRITRCVLKTLRDRLTHAESLQLLAQLPMAIKALYVDGWKYSEKPNKIKTMQEFIDEVIRTDGNSAWKDFSSEEEVIEGINAVFKTLAIYVSPGEIEDVMAVLPRELKIMLTESIMY
ncbi:MAG: DUF2267 domain-containing protein [Bacteroidetes bacterium]|nr:MAG: DUF2267 domain-containing protein [Bacteroidota bacterium]REK05234.1 MAG: DUF2267 domain-containing protein [Bacteroidota bacterium]REK32639.1 MAG: DUF2267 domain-containing protein [Bacteroidota bacterium]REK48914.1 MAG: DUF2267 domain-containing protein [Bacteroidota bacterium]